MAPKDPTEVSGWGPTGGQDFSDIAKPGGKNAEADPAIAHETTWPRGEAEDAGKTEGEKKPEGERRV